MRWPIVLAGFVALGGLGRLATSNIESKPTTCAELTNSDKLGQITVVGRLVDLKSKDTGSVMTLEGRDGFRISCFLSKDIPCPSLRIGSKLKVTGTQIERGVISLDSPSWTVQQDNIANSIYQITVENGIAYFPNGSKASCTLKDGYYPELLMVRQDHQWVIKEE